MQKLLSLAFLILVTGCTSLKVVEIDPSTGFFPGAKRATVVKNIAIELDNRKDLILVPNGDFTGAMVKNIGYFNQVIDFVELEKLIIKNSLTEEVPSVDDRIGLNKAAKAYKPFLWLRWGLRRDGSKEYRQIILTDPVSLEDYFIAETFLDVVWAGVNDQNNYYPMMNSFIEYIKEHSDDF